MGRRSPPDLALLGNEGGESLPLIFLPTGGPGAWRPNCTPRGGPGNHTTQEHTPARAGPGTPTQLHSPRSWACAGRGPGLPDLCHGHTPRFARACPTTSHTPTWTARPSSRISSPAAGAARGGSPGRARLGTTTGTGDGPGVPHHRWLLTGVCARPCPLGRTPLVGRSLHLLRAHPPRSSPLFFRTTYGHVDDSGLIVIH